MSCLEYSCNDVNNVGRRKQQKPVYRIFTCKFPVLSSLRHDLLTLKRTFRRTDGHLCYSNTSACIACYATTLVEDYVVSLNTRIHMTTITIIRPPVRSNGRTYKMLVMFLFFPTRNLRDHSADYRETLSHDWKPHDWKLVLFYNPTSKIRGALPQNKFGGQKHAKFWSILHNLRL